MKKGKFQTELFEKGLGSIALDTATAVLFLREGYVEPDRIN